MKLHNKGWSNKEIVSFLNLNKIQRRNKKDDYTMKHNTQFKIRDWELWREF